MRLPLTGFLAVLLGIVSLSGAEPQIVPATPSLVEIKKMAEAVTIVLACVANEDGTGLVVSEILKGAEGYEAAKGEIIKLLPSSDPEALATEGYRELAFIDWRGKPGVFQKFSTYALWPQREEMLRKQKIIFLALDFEDVKKVIQSTEKKAE